MEGVEAGKRRNIGGLLRGDGGIGTGGAGRLAGGVDEALHVASHGKCNMRRNDMSHQNPPFTHASFRISVSCRVLWTIQRLARSNRMCGPGLSLQHGAGSGFPTGSPCPASHRKRPILDRGRQKLPVAFLSPAWCRIQFPDRQPLPGQPPEAPDPGQRAAGIASCVFISGMVPDTISRPAAPARPATRSARSWTGGGRDCQLRFYLRHGAGHVGPVPAHRRPRWTPPPSPFRGTRASLGELPRLLYL